VVEGIGEDFIPSILDLSLTKKAYSISDEESVGTARNLLLKEGILAGPSSGTLFAAALRYCREQKTPKRVVTLVCDRGDKYLSKTFSDFWMTEQGFTKRAKTNTVEDLIIRRHDQNDTVIVRPNDTLLTAYKRMRVADVSQLPVVDEQNHFIGIVDEAALLEYMAQAKDHMHLDVSVREIMREPAPKLPKGASLEEAAKLLQTASRIIITDGELLLGMVTRVDLLNHFVLRAQVK
jgi:cystathionine beta-synthase